MVRRGFSPFACVFTRGSTDNTTGWRFFPLTTARATADIKSVHGMLEVLNMTADCRFVLWYQESDEPEMFAGDGTTVDVNFTAATTDGYWASVGYIAVTFTKAYVRFGVRLRNEDDNPAKIELAWVSARFDTRAC